MENLPPPPHEWIWNMDEIREALEKSRAALLNNLRSSTSTSTSPDLDLDLINLASVHNLFVVNTTGAQKNKLEWTGYVSYGPEEVERGGWEWGSRGMMLDLGDDVMPSQQQQQQRMAILTAAANLTGRAVHLLGIYLTEEEERCWVEALSLAADRHAGPSSLLISEIYFRDTPALLSALKKNKRLKHLSIQYTKISDECVEVLSDFTSLTSLQLHNVTIKLGIEFVERLADLHPSHSPLAASLHRLHIHSYDSIDWRRSTGFLRHWTQLKELSLFSSQGMIEEALMDFMDLLAPPKKGAETAGNTLLSSPPQLYSLQLGYIDTNELSRSATAAVVDALSRSGLPFFHIQGILSGKANPAFEAQLKRNQRNSSLGLDSTRVPANSMRLFICGDPFAGKTTLISTMRSMYSTSKRDKFMRPLFATQGRTQGIEVGALKKDGIKVSLWDMAGQSEFHAFHDFMFPDIGSSSYQLPSMFMFVWSPIDSKRSEKGAVKNEKSFEASFRYWLRFLASKSRQSNIALKVIVVFTRADQMASLSHAFSTQIDSLRSDFEGLIDILDPPFHVDARKKDSIKAANSVRAVTKHIFDIAKGMLQGIQVYNICTDVNKLLTKHSKKTYEEIITWKKFSEICYSFHFPTAKLEAIALCLNESGNIIYINGIRHMVLNPNWFCNQVMGSLIHFSNSKASKSAIVFTDGCTSRDALEECLESVVKSKVKGSLLVNLMEAMHLCCKVEINNGVPNSHVDRLFIPALLTGRSGLEQLQWRSSTKLNVDEDTFVYMGRRLECEDKKHTFLTPGLFLRVQVLFNKAFQSLEEEYEPNVMLGKDFISICFSNKEIIIVFCQEKSEHVIDVLVRANNPNNSQRCHASITLADVELKHVINTLVTICAQPTGIQGVKLIESVIRPDCLRYPSRTIDREDQCVPITNLKQQLKKKLERGEQKSYDFIDLLGSENYEEVLMSCKLWIKEEAKNPLLSKNDEVNVSMDQQSQHNVRSSEHSLLQEDPIQGDTIEVQSSKLMVKAIRSRTLDRIENKIDRIDHKIDANHKELLMKIDAMHHDLQCLRIDVMTKVEKSINKLLKLTMENESEKQLPRVVILTTINDKKIKKLVTSMLGLSSMQIHLYCEDPSLPHPVENQPGITLMSLLESHRQSLGNALPYINGFFCVLTIAIRLGINFLAPFASSLIPNWTPHLKLAKDYPIISSIIKSKFDTKLSFKEWQKCLESILQDNGGVTDENIDEKFCLRRAIYDNKVDGGTQVAWLCKTHYEAQRPYPLN